MLIGSAPKMVTLTGNRPVNHETLEKTRCENNHMIVDIAADQDARFCSGEPSVKSSGQTFAEQPDARLEREDGTVFSVDTEQRGAEGSRIFRPDGSLIYGDVSVPVRKDVGDPDTLREIFQDLPNGDRMVITVPRYIFKVAPVQERRGEFFHSVPPEQCDISRIKARTHKIVPEPNHTNHHYRSNAGRPRCQQ